jgi:hypothetical protein
MANFTTAPRSPAARAALLRHDGLLLAGLLALSAVPTLAGVVRLIGLAEDDVTMADHARFAADPVPLILHIVGATAFTVLGALQLAPGLRHRHRAWHRVLGRMLAPLGLVAALSGMWMAAFYPPGEHGGPLLSGIRLVVGSAMTAFIVLSLTAIRRRDFAAHGAFMTRAYALGIAAGTQAVLLMPVMLLGVEPSERTYAMVMGAGWVINAAVAELALRRPRGSVRAGASLSR